MPRYRRLSLWVQRSTIRASSFLRKEFDETLRQPQLALALILGPFLILLLFGVGYRSDARPLRTLFVVGEDDELRAEVERYATTLGPQLVFSGITADQASALDQLKSGQVDLVVVVPSQIRDAVTEGKRILIRLYHNELDPVQAQYVSGFGQVYVSEVNRRIVYLFVHRAQEEAASLDDRLGSAVAQAEDARQALETGDRKRAQEVLSELSRAMTELSAALREQVGLLPAYWQSADGTQSDSEQSLLGLLAGLDQAKTWLDQVRDQLDAVSADDIVQFEDNLKALRSTLSVFGKIDPGVLVQLFQTEAESIAPTPVDTQDYYTPSVIVVLLQHLCVTLGGLSIISERRSGTFELFQVSPLSAIEILLGKYASYVLAAGVVSILLTVAVVWGLGVPMVGSWGLYALVLSVLVLVSLGLGFTLSLLSTTTSQVVQYAMIVLLASVFFSGFILGLEMLWKPVRVLSWMLPATYAIRSLQAVMLRGMAPPLELMAALSAMAVGWFAIDWLMLRKALAHR
jgi:ABC-2 type transport system permease protein